MKSKARSLFAWTKRPAQAAKAARFDGRLEELEPRILFSADAGALLLDPTATPAADLSGAIQQVVPPATPAQTTPPEPEPDQAQAQAQAAQGTQATAAASTTELVFVDARVPDAQALMQQILAQQDGQHTLEIHWLSADRDGITQITETLQGRHDVSALHIISHGSDGNVQLGNTWLNEATLPSHLQALSSWQSALTSDADILIYGCDVAQTAAGQHFIDDLALLTGADVAASENKTGAAALGGDWSLEYRIGAIQSYLFQPSATFPQWNHVLATLTLQDGSNSYTGTTDTYLHTSMGIADNTNYSTSTTLLAGEDGTGGQAQTLIRFDNLVGTGANQIAAGSTITAVTLTLQITTASTFTNPTFDFHRMLVSWSDTSTWDSMGSGISVGTEASNTTDGSITESGTGSYTIASNANMVATVQGWINNPSSNYGWYTDNGNYSARIAWGSAENGTLSYRPKLTITYTPPTPPSMDLDANNSSSATGNNYSGAFVENSPAVKVADSDAAITAGGSSSFTGMTVTMGAVPDGAAESLAATTSGTSITASYSSGVLTLSGTDTAANYQSVLRSITYNNTSDTPNTTARSLTIMLTDANGQTATATSTLSVTATNDAPVITSNGGGASASISVAETLTAVTTVTSTDPEGTARSYSIVAGGDGAKFSINASTGVLTFASAPDFESPTDSNADNVYVVTVQASDGSLTDTQTISVTVTDVSSALVVTTTADTNDSGLGSSFTAEQLNAVNAGGDGKISLREALIAANNTAGTDTISFAITGATGSYGEYTITATSALPTITQAVNINAATQSGYVAGGVHTVVLDGNDAAAYGLDLTNTADGSTIRGLVIRNFTAYGIYVESGSDNNTIVGNFIGSFNADGSNKGVGFGNATAGIVTYGANTVIGGTTAADRNVISGNPGGYNIYMATGADGTVVKGNYIGLNAAGTSVFSTTNPNYGIMIETSATNVTMGGTATGSGNVISGHVREGIWVTTTGAVTIQGNYIGTDVTGTVDLGNTRYGIYLDDAGTATIGGTTAGAGNLISGNDLGGIYAANNSVTVLGNIIGLNATGTAKLANTGSGIELRTGAASTIGGNGSGYRNIISGNTSYGIDVETSNAHVIKGNYIGVGADGTTLLGNTLAGVYIKATGTIVGGKTSGDGNTIAGNGGAGIAVAGGTGNLFYRNSIYSNTGIGIDLGNDGVTANDYDDGDGGANYSNNYPVITSVVTNGTSTTITGSIDWYHGPDTVYIELFASTSKDATGYGQGKTYLGAASVTTTTGTGDATFSLTVTGVSVGDWISAVANIETTAIGASEFSKAVQAVAPTNAPRGRVIWNNNDRFYQNYADWSTAGFSGIGTDGLNFSDDISMITAVEAPTRNEILFIGSADASGKILAGIWNGSTWSSVISIPLSNPSASAGHYDSFAVAYDPISGDAMMVWDNGNTGTTGLSYATWNGTSWSAINTITAPVSGEPLHMKLAAKPNSHEMTLVVETSAASNNQYAIVWNGSSWGNAQALGSNTNEQYFELNVAYEQQSGKAMVVYDNSASNSASVQYRTWNGSSWSSEGTITAPVGITSTADLYSTAIASDPTSNRLAIAAKNASDEIWLAVWDGSSWGSTQVATTTGHSLPEDHPSMSVAFESQSGDLLAAYGKSAGPNVYYRTWTSGGGWSAENTGPSIGGTDIPYIVKLYADPYSNTIMMGVQDNAYDLNFVAWDGSAWGSVTELDNNTVFYYRENFTYVWYQNAPVIANLSGDTLAFTEDQSAQVIDQGTSATATLGDQTLYNGGNLTVSFTAGSTNAEDVLAIRNQGTGAGQIGVSGGNVTYAGTVIGTYTGGTSGASLVITFNSNATDAAVSALVKNITYQNTNTSTPSTSTRTVRFVATNSLGQASANNDVSITVTAVNDAPVNTVPGAQSVNEDTTLVFSSGNSNLISIADVDAASSNVQVTLTVTNGTLTLSGITGLSFTVGDGTADTTMTFTGTVSAINTALAGMGYSPTANYNGSDTLTILTSDLGNTGSGGTLTDSDTVAITINAVNDAPVATITPISYNATEQVSLTLHGTGLSISDIDAGSSNVQATLSVTSGTLTVSAGATGVLVSGSSTNTITLTGTLTQINNLLAGNGGATLSYIINSDAPPASDTLTLLASDLGNTGTGGTLTGSDTATINITPVNDAPTVSITAPSYSVVQAQNLLLHNTGLSVTDPDGTGTSVQVTLSADLGTLTVAAGTSGVSVSGSGTGSVTLSGTVAQINNLLQGNAGATVSYINDSGTPTASATLTLAIDDLGNTGGGNLTASGNVAINVVPAAAMGSVAIPGVAPTDIAAYYGFDANANLGRDDAAGGHDMTLIGTPTPVLGHDGRTSGFGVTNDETGAAPQTGGNIAGLSTGGAMTISLWVKFDSFNDASGGFDRVIDFGQAGATGIGNIVLARAATSQQMTFVLQHDNVNQDYCTTAVGDVVQTGQWAYIACTVDNAGTMNIYFNGQLSGTFSGTALATGVRTNNYVAQSNWAGSYGMNGAVDDLLVVNRAMTATEVAALYNQANGLNVYEKAANGTTVGTVVDGSSIDGRTVTYSLTNSAAGRFAINSSTGEITVADSANLLYADASHYTLTVRATDSGGFALDTNYTVNLLDINDAPVGTAHTVGALEDTPYVFGTSDFGFTDPSDASANALLAVKITAIPASGTLTLNGVAVSANDVIQASDIAAGKLQFTAAADANGAGYASFDFKVQDDGGTAHGGTDMDATARTMTIDVASVNDAPQGSDKTVTTLEDTPYVFSNSDFGFSDVDGNAFLGVKITSVPAAGSLTLNGVAVSANDVILASDIAAGRLQLAPAADANGTGYSSFQFKVQDDGGTTNAGVNLDTSARTLTLDVTPVNDAPVGADKTVTTNEDTSYVFSASDFGFTDPDDSPANSLQAVKLTTLPASGSLTLNGSAVSVGQLVAVADINAGLLVFAPAANAHGVAYATLGFQVQDNGGTANGGVNLDATTRTLTINVTAVNDAPTTQDEAVSGNEDTVITGAVSGADVDGDSLGFSKGSDPTHGSVSVAANGSFSYTPNANYNGTDSFTVTVSDGQGGTATSTVTVTINAVNDAPAANNPGVSGNEDTVITGQVTASDVDNDPLSFSKASDPTHGSVTVNSDGSFSYTPTANYNGTDSFTVTVSDGQGGTTTSTINVTITAVNDAPTINDLSVSGNEDTAISGQVTGTDVDGNPLSYTKATDPAHGSVSVAANGNFVYTPNANYDGTDSFTVTVSDGQGGTATATVNVTVVAVNDAPTADNPGVIGAEDTVVTGQVTGADVDGDTLSYTKTSNPTHGSAIVNSDGSFSYTPAANFNGSDSFTVTVSDGHGGSVLSTVSITVTPVNDAPVSNNPSVSGAEDTVITGAIIASDVEGDTLSYQVSSDPVHGQVTVASDGSFSYTPTANYNGTDSFTVLVSDGQGGTTTSTVSVNITAVNDAPVTSNVAVSGAEDTAIVGLVTGTDVDGDTLSYAKGSDPTHGSVTVNSDGSFSYTPTANFNGSDSFTVTVSDGQGGTATSTVSITVTPVNDAPTTSNVAVTGAEDTSIAGQVIGNDVDGDTLTYAKGSNPAYGSVTVNTDGSFSYTPTANFSGSDSFTVTVSDGQGGTATSTVSITVTPVNDAPVTYNIAVSGAEDTAITGQVTGSDADHNPLSYTKGSDPTHGSITVNSDGSFSYTPTANFNGSDSFTVTVSDGQGGTATSTIAITVTPVNDVPVTGNVTASGAEDTAVTGQVTGTDADGDTLSYAKGSDPTHGSVTVQADGSFNYTPTANFHGSDSFTVTVSDGQGGTATSTVSITVSAVNDAPATHDVTTSGAEDTAIIGQVTGTDVDGDTLSYTKGSDPAHGSVTVNGNGSFSYTPTANFSGSDSFTVTVSDGQGGTATSTVLITVTPVNDAPVTGNVAASGAEDTPIVGQVTGSDVEGDTLSYAKGSDPTHGSVTVQADGSFSYTPTANYNGTDSFVVTVSDGQGGTATSNVTITVTPVADSPIMSADTLSAAAAPSATWASSTLLNGASDPDGGTLAVRIIQGPQHGSLTMAGNGQLTYTADSGYTGTDSFLYEAFDGQLASSNTRVMNIQASGFVPVAPISTPPSTDTTSSPDQATQDTTGATRPTPEPSTPEAKPSSSETPATAAKPQPEAKPEDPQAAPTTALHERVQAGSWFGGRPADNNAAARQILFTGANRDYFSNAAWGNTNSNSVVTQLLDLIKPTLERVQDINLMLTPLNSVTQALPAQSAMEASGDTRNEELGQTIRLNKVASYSTGLGLSIGTIWWTARISGLVTSALISTPAWRSLDPLPVVTSPSDDPDHDEDGDSRLGDREVEHLFDGDKPIEQDMPVIQ